MEAANVNVRRVFTVGRSADRGRGTRSMEDGSLYLLDDTPLIRRSG